MPSRLKALAKGIVKSKARKIKKRDAAERKKKTTFKVRREAEEKGGLLRGRK